MVERGRGGGAAGWWLSYFISRALDFTEPSLFFAPHRSVFFSQLHESNFSYYNAERVTVQNSVRRAVGVHTRSGVGLGVGSTCWT